MAFREADAAKLLVDCLRYCCVCQRWRGSRIELHHIEPVRGGGSDDIENAIPVCFDCHAEIEARGPRGRRYSADELRMLKLRWLELVRDHPELLVRAAQGQLSPAGPLEALVSELEFNIVAAENRWARFASHQFDRCVAANALSALDRALREKVFAVYRDIAAVNGYLDVYPPMELRGASDDVRVTWADSRSAATRQDLPRRMRPLIEELAAALGLQPENE